MMRWLVRLIASLLVIFILPSLVHAALWMTKDQPDNWRAADWSSAGILPSQPAAETAQIMVLAARTGGLKGAFATHSWIVLKKPGETRYHRYEVVGWGRPIRKNAYDPDGRWYSNQPQIHHRLTGKNAADLIPAIEKAIAAYRWNDYGDYTIWPGPNSNTFVAAILRAVPELRARTPSTAIGRDFPTDGRWASLKDGTLRLSLMGYAGLVAGRYDGFELNFLGLVAGLNPMAGEIKIPSFGSYRLLQAT